MCDSADGRVLTDWFLRSLPRRTRVWRRCLKLLLLLVVFLRLFNDDSHHILFHSVENHCVLWVLLFLISSFCFLCSQRSFIYLFISFYIHFSEKLFFLVWTAPIWANVTFWLSISFCKVYGDTGVTFTHTYVYFHPVLLNTWYFIRFFFSLFLSLTCVFSLTDWGRSRVKGGHSFVYALLCQVKEEENHFCFIKNVTSDITLVYWFFTATRQLC